MSSIRDWLFGSASAPAAPAAPSGSSAILAPALDSTPKADAKDEHFSGFDPRGLERAANALRELEKNALGKDAIALQMQEEKTKAVKLGKETEEAKAKQQDFAFERARAVAFWRSLTA